MTIAAERLAVIAVITLPITALWSVLGMNIIVNDRTDFAFLATVLIVMVVMSAALLTWAKRKDGGSHTTGRLATPVSSPAAKDSRRGRPAHS
jgi:hypothetical protein